jgi:hypothetical protein
VSKNKTSYFNISIIVIALLFAGGWCANIYKIISNGFEIAQWGGMEIARVIGVFVAPLGALLGFF